MSKIRTSFVTNSSSSSFVCVICGEEASGWDMGLRDAGMYECENGHVFCDCHILPSIEKPDISSEDEDEEDDDDRYQLTEKRCPICQFKIIKKDDAFDYILKIMSNLTEESILKGMKEQCKDYATLQEFIKEKK